MLICIDNMRPRINKANTPSSMKVFSTFTTPEEQKVLKERRDTLKELDAIKASKHLPEFAYVKIFGIEKLLPISEIQNCNFKWYTK